jgi:hypothetical protein
VAKREVEILGRSRGEEVRRVRPANGEGGGGSRRVWIVAGLIGLILLAGLIALFVIDSRQRAGTEPPSGVEEFDVGTAGKHTQANVDYEQQPPAGGEHNPVWQNSGFYEEPVRNETAVHTLEHGAVWITYNPDLPQDQRDALREIVEAQDCLLASPYPGLDTPIVASAWGAQVRLDSVDDPNLQNFIGFYRKGPQTPEPGAACTRGTGDPA